MISGDEIAGELENGRHLKGFTDEIDVFDISPVQPDDKDTTMTPVFE